MLRNALIAAIMLGASTVAGAQATAHRVKINGMQMYYEVSGAGEPLIVLHGAYMNIPMMGPIIPLLAKPIESMRSSSRDTDGPPTSIAPSRTPPWRTMSRRSWIRLG